MPVASAAPSAPIPSKFMPILLISFGIKITFNIIFIEAIETPIFAPKRGLSMAII